MTEPPDHASAIAGMTADLRACFGAADTIASLIAFRPQVPRVSDLPRVPGQFNTVAPHPLTGIALMLVAGALQHTGRGREIQPFVSEIADLFAPPHRYYRPGSNLSDILHRFPFLNVPLIRGALADNEQLDAVALCLRYAERGDAPLGWIFDDPSGRRRVRPLAL